MAIITPEQLSKITTIVENHMNVLRFITVGHTTPSPELVQQLGLTPELTNLVQIAYKYGKLGVLLGKDLSSMTEGEIIKLIDDIKLTKPQQYAMEMVRTRSQQFIDTLSQKVTSNVVNTIVHSQLQMHQAIQEVIPEAIKHHTERYDVVSQLREQTGDWKRDWDRVAHTELWDAKLQGEAQAILNNESPFSTDGGETLVYKKPAPDCCAACRKAYLENDGVTPKVFKLSELMSNGSNYGKKGGNWVPTLGVMHPNCQCTMNVKPPDTEFDKRGNLVYRRNKS